MTEDKRRRTGLWTRKDHIAWSFIRKIKRCGCKLPGSSFLGSFSSVSSAVLKQIFNLSVREVDAAADL